MLHWETCAQSHTWKIHNHICVTLDDGSRLSNNGRTANLMWCVRVPPSLLCYCSPCQVENVWAPALCASVFLLFALCGCVRVRLLCVPTTGDCKYLFTLYRCWCVVAHDCHIRGSTTWASSTNLTLWHGTIQLWGFHNKSPQPAMNREPPRHRRSGHRSFCDASSFLPTV